jgi:sec-independent protein translocase protein TatC
MSHDAMADKAAARDGGDEPEESLDDGMTLTEHLSELRSRIIRSALAVAIGMVLVVAFYDQVLDFLIVPYKDLCDARGPTFCDAQVYNFTPTEGLSTRLRVGMYGGIILALPRCLSSHIASAFPGMSDGVNWYAEGGVVLDVPSVPQVEVNRILHRA